MKYVKSSKTDISIILVNENSLYFNVCIMPSENNHSKGDLGIQAHNQQED